MKKKAKMKKIIATVLSAIIMTQVIPISASAIQNLKRTEIGESSLKESVPNIVKEIKDERGEFNKVYLLEDGSYCNISTFAPIHKIVNGKWENIKSSTTEDVETIEQAKTELQSISSEQHTINIKKVAQKYKTREIQNDSSFTFNIVNGSLDNGTISLSSWGSFAIKQNSLGKYIDQNKLITNVSINANYDCITDDEDTCTVSIYEMPQMNWDEQTDLSNISIDENSYIEQSVFSTDGSGLISWDITDIYSKWDKNVKSNTGFYVKVDTIYCEISLSSICVSVIYRDIDESDALSTYHSIFMEKAGTTYVNDLTNTVKMEQEILTVPRKIMPIHLKRIYNLSDNFGNTNASGFRWNYESSIFFKDNIVLWKTFDGTVKRFIKSDPIVESGGYIKWNIVSSDNSQDASLWIKTSESLDGEYDYSNFYIVSNNIYYRFNTQGKLISMNIENDTNYEIKFNYTNNKLISISYLNDNVRTYINIEETNGTTDVSISSYDKLTKKYTHNEFVTIESRIVNYDNVETVIFQSGETVSYVFNTLNQLIKVTDEKNDNLELFYYDDGRLLSYVKEFASGDAENVDIINEDTYRRYFSYSNYAIDEVIQYDKSFNVISHRDTAGKYTFASYDENGVVNSYAVSESVGTQMLQNAGFESTSWVGTWIKGKNPTTIKIGKYVNEESESLPKNITPVKIDKPENGENYCCSFSSDPKISTTLSQTKLNLVSDKTYVFGAWVYVKRALATGNISVSVGNTAKRYEVKFDPTAVGCWQYNLMACKFNDTQKKDFRISITDQSGEIFIDNVTLYEATAASVDLIDNISSSPYEIERTSDGKMGKEIITDGVMSLIRSYEYGTNDYRPTAVTDFNGITTYYDYYNRDSSTTVKSVGTVKDSSGKIIDPTNFTYVAGNLPKSIEQSVKNVLTSEKIQMKAEYEYNGNEVETVEYNGVKYSFIHTTIEDGYSLYTISKNNSDATSEEWTGLIQYKYTDDGKIITYNNRIGEGQDESESQAKTEEERNKIEQRNRSKQVTIQYTYSNGVITQIEIKNSNVTYQKFIYTYDSNNEVESVVETLGNTKTKYINNGYEIYSLSDSTTIPVFKKTESTDGIITETYHPDVYSTKSDNLKDKNPVTKAYSKTSRYFDMNTDETTESSSQTISRVKNWESDTNYAETIYSIKKSSVSDYFGRITRKLSNVKSNDNSEVRFSEKYDYKDLSDSTTSTLLTSHSTQIDYVDSNQRKKTLVNKSMYYEYDKAGNIVFQYYVSEGNIRPVAYYEYDSANQLVGEYNVDNEVCARYTYDAGGNITKKVYYNVDTVVCNNESHKIVDYGTVKQTISYVYENDLLKNYNGINIGYDDLGNPLKYCGKSYSVSVSNKSNTINDGAIFDVSGKCEWVGNYLTSIETDTNKYVYEYDENGYRVKKTVLKKNQDKSYSTVLEVVYVWNNEKLNGIIYNSFDQQNENQSVSSMQADIIYDQEGEAIGFIYQDSDWYFVKDINGSVVGMINNGKEPVTISYDAWGLPSLHFIVDDSEALGMLQYVLLNMIVPFNPVSYKGYLYDYEVGLFFAKDKVYSPAWGRYLNSMDLENKTRSVDSTISLNGYSFCNNNPINSMEPYSYISKIRESEFAIGTESYGIDVQMNEAFTSNVFCTIFAGSLIKKYGSNKYSYSDSIYGMDTEFMAQSLFAHNIAKYKPAAFNAINSSWGDGWFISNSQSDSVKLYKDDPHVSKYKMIWDAGYALMAHI